MIFAKQPIAGQVKTRLQPEFTPAQAAQIAEFLIRETVELAVSSWPDPIYLCGAPDADHPLFRELADRFGVVLLANSVAVSNVKPLSIWLRTARCGCRFRMRRAALRLGHTR